MEKVIDKQATLDAIRERYGSVEAFMRVHSFNKQTLYATIRGDRGTEKGRPAVIGARLIEMLRDENLLVEVKAG